jgi:hypothetical protein
MSGYVPTTRFRLYLALSYTHPERLTAMITLLTPIMQVHDFFYVRKRGVPPVIS